MCQTLEEAFGVEGLHVPRQCDAKAMQSREKAFCLPSAFYGQEFCALSANYAIMRENIASAECRRSSGRNKTIARCFIIHVSVHTCICYSWALMLMRWRRETPVFRYLPLRRDIENITLYKARRRSGDVVAVTCVLPHELLIVSLIRLRAHSKAGRI